MKKTMFALLVMALCCVVTSAFAADKMIQGASGSLLTTANGGSAPSLVWSGRSYSEPLDCWDHPFDITSDDNGTYRVSVYLVAGETFHQANPIQLSDSWDGYRIYLGMNFLDSPGSPAVDGQSMGKSPLGRPWDGESTRIEFRGVRLPKAPNRTLLLTLPTIYEGRGSLKGEDGDKHPWGHIQWFMDGYLGRGPISAYAVQYNNGRYLLAGKAKERPPVDRN